MDAFFMTGSALVETGMIIILATVLAYVARYLKQPLLVAYVFTGILIGPVGLGLIKDLGNIEMLAEFGTAFLLFTIGLEIDVPKLRSVGAASVVGGLIQILSTFALGFLVSLWIGFNYVVGIYIGSLVAFSSTMIVAKLLVDRNEINTLHGRIMLGVLVLQDLAVILILPVLRSIDGMFSYDVFINAVVNGIGLFSLAIVLNRYVFKKVLEKAARSGELLFLTTVSVCFAFIAVSETLRFPVAIGAFFGGIALAQSPYNLEIYGKMRSLRDFFLVIFFSTLGVQLNLTVLSTMIPQFLIILLLVVIVKPLILSLIYLAMGYGGRTSSIIGLGMSQASEFSFILAFQGLRIFNHISQDVFSLIVSVIVISIIITPYLMKFRKNIYGFFSSIDFPGKHHFGTPTHVKKLEKKPETGLSKHVVVFGCDVMGSRIVDYLKNQRIRFIVAEHNPETIRKLTSDGVYALYGDADNEDLLKEIGLYKAKLAIITIPDIEIAGFVISKARRFNPGIKIYARAHCEEDAQVLYKAGADFVVVPDFVSGGMIIRKIEYFLGGKNNHIRHVDVRKK